jgi:hypothetical protein
MEGIRFVREDHLSIADGFFLPRADLLGLIQSRLHELVYSHPELKGYVPNLLEVDVFVMCDLPPSGVPMIRKPGVSRLIDVSLD